MAAAPHTAKRRGQHVTICLAPQSCPGINECPDTARVAFWDLRERRMTQDSGRDGSDAIAAFRATTRMDRTSEASDDANTGTHVATRP